MYLMFKRIMDFLVAATVLFLISPLFLIAAVILKLTGEHEVFYWQERIGYKNRSFYIYKFATMVKDAPNMKGGTITLRNDPRVTRVGRVLRMTKLNELPQLINILRGDMSIVGPRPMLPKGFKKYPEHVQLEIYNVRPGLTGIGSVVFRDEEKIVSNAPSGRIMTPLLSCTCSSYTMRPLS